MKILHITNNYPTPEFPIYGIFVKEQIDSLNALGIVNDVFFINGKKGGKIEYLKAIFELKKHFSKNIYDIIHCHHCFSGIVYICSGKRYKRPCILSYQNDPKKEGGKLLFKIMYKFFDKIIIKNNSKFLKCSNSIHLPNGVNLGVFKPMDKILCKRQLGLDENKKYILFMDSNKHKRTQKRFDRFEQIIDILKEKYLKNDIEPLILTNTERHLVPVYICSSELHLLTSDFEGSPNSVKECIACNIPVVSTPVGNVNDLIGDINGCYVSKTFDIQELADLVVKALDTVEFSSRNYIINKGLELNRVANKLYQLYNSL